MTDKQIALLIINGNDKLAYILFKQLGYKKNKIKRLIIKTLWEEYGHLVDKKVPQIDTQSKFYINNKLHYEFSNKRDRILELLRLTNWCLGWVYVRKQNVMTTTKIVFRQKY